MKLNLLLLALAAAATLAAMPATPTAAGIAPGPGTINSLITGQPVDIVYWLYQQVSQFFPAECGTRPGMSQAQCTQLNRLWAMTPKCLEEPLLRALNAPPGVLPLLRLPDSIRAKLAPFASWVSGGCPTSCALAAKKKGINPKAFCDKANMPTSFRDGGCKTFVGAFIITFIDEVLPAGADARLTPQTRLPLDPLQGHVPPPALVRLDGQRHQRPLRRERQLVHQHPIVPVVLCVRLPPPLLSRPHENTNAKQGATAPSTSPASALPSRAAHWAGSRASCAPSWTRTPLVAAPCRSLCRALLAPSDEAASRIAATVTFRGS